MNRNSSKTVILVLISCCGPVVSVAQNKPEVKSLSPFTIVAGRTTSVTVYGDNLTPKRVLSSHANVKASLKEVRPTTEALKNKGNTQVTIEVIVMPGAPAESLDVTMVQADGAKLPVLLPIVEETTSEVAVKKPSSTYVTANQISGRSLAITGTIDADSADVFRFDAKSGEVCDISLYCGRGGSSLDPVIRVRDSRHACLMLSAGDKKKDRRLSFKTPYSGSYYIEITDAEAKGGGGYDYRLTFKRKAQ